MKSFKELAEDLLFALRTGADPTKILTLADALAARGEMEKTDRRSVLQDWMHGLTFMQQAVILAAIRGPDGLHKEHPAKSVMRWYRRCTLIASFEKRVLELPHEPGGGSFTGPVAFTDATTYNIDEVEIALRGARLPEQRVPLQNKLHARLAEALTSVFKRYLKACDEVPLHFHGHLMHGVQILGYKHPTPWIRASWRDFYELMVSDLHLNPETEEEMDKRLGDSEKSWRARDKVYND